MKKVVSLLLVAVLALGMSTMAFAAGVKVVKDPTANPGSYTPAYAGSNVTGAPGSQIIDFTDSARAGDEKFAEMPLVGGTTTFFTLDSTTATYTATAGLTKAAASQAKVTMKTRISKGSAAIDKIELNYGATGNTARIKVALVNPFVSNNEDGLEFEATAYILVDGKSWLDIAPLSIAGTLKNVLDDTNVDKDTTYFDFSDGKTIMKPTELVKSMEYYLGENVSVFGRALKNAKYYAVAKTSTTDADDANILKYDLDGVYHIKAVNLASVASYVTLGDADATQYIYDGDMKYLGRGNDHLPYAETYYLSAKELDTDASTDEEEPTDESSDEEPVAPNPGTGADDNYPTNVNDNPGTGR